MKLTINQKNFSRVHRLGKARNNHQRRRPIVARVFDSKMKAAVMSKGRELKKSSFSISDQFPAEIMRRQRLLYPAVVEARKSKWNARLSVDKFCIDGKLYRNSRITYWLSGGNDGISHDAQEEVPVTGLQHASSGDV